MKSMLEVRRRRRRMVAAVERVRPRMRGRRRMMMKLTVVGVKGVVRIVTTATAQASGRKKGIRRLLIQGRRPLRASAGEGFKKKREKERII